MGFGSVLRGLVVTLVVVSCGDGDDGSSTIGESEPPPPSTSPTSTSTPSPPPCVDGEQQTCTCSDGMMASQVCQGGAFGACACPLPPSAWNLLGCFTKADGFATCDGYCRAQGRQCAAESCNIDGSLTEFGYTWVSWPASEGPRCDALEPPDQVSFDTCITPIWLQPTKADDDLVRCCCR